MKIIPARKVWMDGIIVDWEDANIHVMTHGLHYGLAIFEGIRCYQTDGGPAVFRMRDHFRRFLDGMRIYRMKTGHEIDDLCIATKNLLRMNDLCQAYIRPIAFTGYGEISPDMSDAKVSVAICAQELGSYFGRSSEDGIKCMVSSWRRMNPEFLSPHVKSSANYLNSAMAKMEAKEGGYDEAILLSSLGHVAEASSANLFLVKDGRLTTPPGSDGILPGITRDCVIKIADRLGIYSLERNLLRDELYVADEAFLCGTACGITPILEIDRRCIGDGKAGGITRKIRNAYSAITKGQGDGFGEWLEPI